MPACSSLTCPRVCQWPFCGVQIKDGDTLQWHYEAHYAQELDRLDKVNNYVIISPYTSTLWI